MRVNLPWNWVVLSSKLKLVWNRITFSRLTIIYFAFSFLHFLLQFSLQIRVFTVNADASRFLNDIVVQGRATNGSLPFLRGSTLYMCSWVPTDLSLNGAGCKVVWNGTKGTNTVGAQPVASAEDVPSIPFQGLISTSTTTTSTSVVTSSPTSTAVSELTAPLASRIPTVTIFVLPQPTSALTSGDDVDIDQPLTKRSTPQILAVQEDGQTQIKLTGMGFNDTPATLDRSCLWALNWPVSILKNTQREDLVFIAFQFWVLGMSIVALLNESIPHILASLITHMMATSWAAFQIANTATFRSDFTRVITDGACNLNGASLLPYYWRDRGGAEIPILVLNVIALLLSCFLTWRLIRLFGWQTFKRIGASLTINRVYMIVLVLSVTIQLCLFFILATVSLWLDQLSNRSIGDRTSFEKLYKITSVITLVLLVPWLMTGWFGIRRELRIPMFVFLLLSWLYLGGWGVMFFSTTFRWTFVTWRFFSVMASASVFLTMGSFILGVVCRFNFGKGLLRYLSTQQTLPGDDPVYYGGSDIEKVAFPSIEKPTPTYAASFPIDNPPVTHGSRTWGPRFFNKSVQPFDAAQSPQPVFHILTRKVSTGSSHNGWLSRSGSLSSNESAGSLESYLGPGVSHARADSKSKRWVIE